MEKNFVEIKLELSEDLVARLKAEAAKTGKTIDEIVNEAIKRGLEETRVINNKVLDSMGKGGSHFILCLPGMRNYKYFDIMREIRGNTDASAIEISFGSGSVLRITKETTWDEVRAYLKAIF